MLLCTAVYTFLQEGRPHLLGALQAVLRPVDDDDALGAPHKGAVRRQDAHCTPCTRSSQPAGRWSIHGQAQENVDDNGRHRSTCMLTIIEE